MKLIQKASDLGYRHYSNLTIKELDELPTNSPEKQIEYFCIQKWLRDIHNIHLNINTFWLFDGNIIYELEDIVYTGDALIFSGTQDVFEKVLEFSIKEALNLLERLNLEK